MSIEIVDYDPRWPKLAEQAIGELNEALPGAFTRIEHFGSTAVPGLAAKPVIDLMAGVLALGSVTERLDRTLPEMGYVEADIGMQNRLFFWRDQDGRRTHHLHIVLEDLFDSRLEILLRDYLREHPADAARYGALKRSVIAAEPDLDMDTYTRRKTDLIQEIVDAARAEKGLPSVDVWEE
jgi:GrpB-like predicted nucleotidyltransferase (UPF0157 family)